MSRSYPLALGLHDLVEGLEAVLQVLQILEEALDAAERGRRQFALGLRVLADGRLEQRRQLLRLLLQPLQSLLVRRQVSVQQLNTSVTRLTGPFNASTQFYWSFPLLSQKTLLKPSDTQEKNNAVT